MPSRQETGQFYSSCGLHQVIYIHCNTKKFLQMSGHSIRDKIRLPSLVWSKSKVRGGSPNGTRKTMQERIRGTDRF